MRSLKHIPAAVNATFVAVALFGFVAPAKARLVEEKIMVPVRAVTIQGMEVAQKIVVTIFYEEAAAKPYPVLVINHGRSAQREERAALGRVRELTTSRWFASLGFMVALPTRVGYGVSGGEDVEYSGACKSKNFPPVYAASAAQTLQALEVLRSRPDVARDRTVFLGQSFGGTTSITLAALNPPGVQAAINFAGGGGGNPKTLPQQPCGQPGLKSLFSDYGKTARVPTLWIYSENDMYWGPKLPKEWFDAFRAAGGIGEFRQFPPLGDDGHRFFSRARETWQPQVLQFLRANGYPNLQPTR